MPVLGNAKAISDGVYDVPSKVGEPCGYEVPTSSTLPSSRHAALGTLVEGKLHGKTGWHGDGTLSNPATHEYQEPDVVPKSMRLLQEVS